MTEYKVRLKAEEEARLVENSSHESKEREYAKLKVEERVRLSLEVRQRAQEWYLGLNAEKARLKY